MQIADLKAAAAADKRTAEAKAADDAARVAEDKARYADEIRRAKVGWAGVSWRGLAKKGTHNSQAKQGPWQLPAAGEHLALCIWAP